MIPAAVLLILATPLAAQPTELTLDQAIQIALAESYSARTLLLREQRAEQAKRAAEGRFKTNADFSLDAPDFAEQFTAVQIRNQPVFYNATGTTRWQGSLRVNQPLPTNGRLSLSTNLQQIDTSTYLDSLDQRERDSRFFTSLRLDFSQPLFTPNTLKLGLERADLELERAQMQYTRTQLDVVFDVTSSFYSYYRALRSLEISREEAEQQQRSFELARTKYEAGLIPEVEALQMEVDLAQSQNDLLSAEGAVERASDAFKLTLGLPLEEDVVVDTVLDLQLYEVEPEVAVRHALRHRAEIREAAIDLRLAEITLAETDARSTIRGDLRAFYDIAGVSNPEAGGNTFDLFDSSWNDLKDRPNNRGIAFSLSVPLWDSGVNGAEVAGALLALEQSRMDSEEDRRRVTQSVHAALTSLREARGRLEVLGKSGELAQRSYDISLARFENGEITSQDLALDRDRLTQAKQAYLGAYIEYQLATAELKRQTLYDFAAGQSLVGG